MQMLCTVELKLVPEASRHWRYRSVPEVTANLAVFPGPKPPALQNRAAGDFAFPGQDRATDLRDSCRPSDAITLHVISDEYIFI